MVCQKVARKKGKPTETDTRRTQKVGRRLDKKGTNAKRRGRSAHSQNSWLARRNQLKNEGKR
jgi:hypothetical protein